MCKKGENIYRRKDRRWEGRYVVGRRENGKPRYRSVYASSYAAAQEKLLVRKYEQYGRQPLTDPYDQTFEDWAFYWLNFVEKAEIKASTYEHYRRVIQKHLLPRLGWTVLRAVTKETLQKALKDWQDSLAPGTVQSVFRILKSILKCAHEKGLCGEPWLGLRVGGKSRNPRVLTRCEQKKLEHAALDIGMPEVFLGLYTGLRVGELCALRWEDIDWQGKCLHVNRTVQRLSFASGASRLVLGTPKSESSKRTIPLQPFLIDLLREWHKGRKGVYILSLTESGAAEPRTLQARFTRLTRSLGIAGAHMHTLRHTFATRCLEKNVGFEVLSALLGHSSPQITISCYSHCTEEQKRASISKLGQFRQLAC